MSNTDRDTLTITVSEGMVDFLHKSFLFYQRSGGKLLFAQWAGLEFERFKDEVKR